MEPDQYDQEEVPEPFIFVAVKQEVVSVIYTIHVCMFKQGFATQLTV
jgi:hypothetical protein